MTTRDPGEIEVLTQGLARRPRETALQASGDDLERVGGVGAGGNGGDGDVAVLHGAFGGGDVGCGGVGERVAETGGYGGKGNSVFRARWAGEAGFDGAEVEFDDFLVVGFRGTVTPEVLGGSVGLQ